MEANYELAQSDGLPKGLESAHYSQRGSIDRDQADLMRLGKKPVLKASQYSHECPRLRLTLFAAQVWVYVIAGIQLHNSYYLGGHLTVGLSH